VTYGAQAEGISEGRYPDATTSIVAFAYATPGAPNTLNFPVEFAVTTNNSLQLEWPSIVGMKFQVQATADLTPPVNWQGVQDVTAANTAPLVELQFGAGNYQFFRVVRLP
jgi:hypothetical protein